MNGTTYYEISREVILNRAKDYYVCRRQTKVKGISKKLS